MEPWYKLVTPRKEVREGRSFNPDEFAIALEQVVAGEAPPDYQLPAQFFARTSFTLWQEAYPLGTWAAKTQGGKKAYTIVTDYAQELPPRRNASADAAVGVA